MLSAYNHVIVQDGYDTHITSALEIHKDGVAAFELIPSQRRWNRCLDPNMVQWSEVTKGAASEMGKMLPK